MPIVYLNGQYLPSESATISIEDRGFLFADGIYEVIRLYRGRPFELQKHLERLQHSAQGIGLALPAAAAELPSMMQRLLAENKLQDTNVYIQCTRGAAHPRTHAFPAVVQPTLLVMPSPVYLAPRDALSAGVKTVTAPDQRWRRCDVKSIMLLPNVLAKQHARDAGAFEAILVRDGLVTEGSSTNLFAVISGAVVTHPADHAILNGITRQVVLDLAANLEFEVHQRAFSADELYAAEEAFLTSTSIEILPITHVDGRQVGTGRPGPITLRLAEAFHRKVAS